jgi:hypothetical protein
MEEITKNQINGDKPQIERGDSVKYHDDDEGAIWSISSNGGISRSSHDDGFVFQSKKLDLSDKLFE